MMTLAATFCGGLPGCFLPTTAYPYIIDNLRQNLK
jgi:hypothetical protein